MELIQEHADLSAYLVADDVVDHDHPTVRETAAALRAAAGAGAHAYAEAAFEFVRDTVPHSADSGDLRVSWRASDVLATRNGICYAKSHALAALLRAEGIPTAFCYQRLVDEHECGDSCSGGAGACPGGPAAVHGLVAVLLPGRDAWARLDPRGNKPGVDARFSLDEERLAFPVRPELGEVDYPVLHADPHPPTVRALRNSADRLALWANLPTALPA
ncbi:transglutaminase-like domain-containing protein [Streptomyces bambusae]|uniref:Transglutaminase n=1 Tax=Streptomyces bambusae TaxID=1550616 RepID=A0ABS6Z7S3_9ACTN|nr:transglutaminase family protein [Streptomyces bambusae]MBW5483809.1 transglutaminase [Streptomyces bambusae]